MKTLILVPFSLMLSAGAAAFECPPHAKEVLKSSTRLLAVRTPGWNDFKGTMRVWERKTPDEPWTSTAAPEPVVVGRHGLAWGHNDRASASGGMKPKREGDGRTPAGVHAIGPRFGFAAEEGPDDIPLKPTTFCVDDPASRHYNRIVDAARVKKDWNSAEDMSRIDVYRLGFEVKYESDAAAKAGSCIFLHLWKSANEGTAGCVAMAEPVMKRLREPRVARDAAIAILPASEWKRWQTCFPGLK